MNLILINACQYINSNQTIYYKLQYSPPAIKAALAGIRDHYASTDTYNNTEFLVFAIDWNSSEATFDWAQNLLDQYPNTAAILSTCQLLNIDSDGKTPLITSKGFEFWIDFIHKNDQIFLTMNSHYHGAANMVAKNAYGRDVLMMVVDY
ncbi:MULTISPECIES: hypothetical protein [unclassified Photobacterium]|uniref:hypothetical protein n=1 Tax=unclassified Photobacterium TaxID=2628852 RepID=UPI001EDDEE65|nr:MULTISPECIES: hypothetical protein [unclassified Photobacterium]